jgi:hypothetical protein
VLGGSQEAGENHLGFQELDENHLSFQANSHSESCWLSLFLTQGLKIEFFSSHQVENWAS